MYLLSKGAAVKNIADASMELDVQAEVAGKPFLITETGAGGIYRYHNPYNSKWTEEYQADNCLFICFKL